MQDEVSQVQSEQDEVDETRVYNNKIIIIIITSFLFRVLSHDAAFHNSLSAPSSFSNV